MKWFVVCQVALLQYEVFVKYCKDIQKTSVVLNTQNDSFGFLQLYYIDDEKTYVVKSLLQLMQQQQINPCTHDDGGLRKKNNAQRK